MGLRDSIQHDERRPQQLEQRPERDLGLGLDAAGTQDLHVPGLSGGVVEEHRLADPRLADEGKRGAQARARPDERVIDGSPLFLAPQQHGPILGPDETPS